MTSGSGLGRLNHDELALLTPEYLLAGHLIDRAGMPHLIGALGREAIRDIAIEEWMGASPVYTRRMQRALGFEGDSVETVFKGMQIDVGAPPQFMDFRYRVVDHDHGEFWLDHCGALMDVEPLGPDYVVAMCHDIEDPTFEATAIATNPRAQVRPIHRPPRVPADRTPHCHWTVTIADTHPPLAVPAQAEVWRLRGQPISTWPRSIPATPVATTTPVRCWPTSSSRIGRRRRCGGSSTRCASRATCWPSRSWPPRPGGQGGPPRQWTSAGDNSPEWPGWRRTVSGTRWDFPRP